MKLKEEVKLGEQAIKRMYKKLDRFANKK